jgi:hypothetical protein
MSIQPSSSVTHPSRDAMRPLHLHAVDADRTSVLDQLLTAIQEQLSAAEAGELFHLGLEDTRLFAGCVLSAYADGRLKLDSECRRAAIRLLR